jgi:hypothetical protein
VQVIVSSASIPVPSGLRMIIELFVRITTSLSVLIRDIVWTGMMTNEVCSDTEFAAIKTIVNAMCTFPIVPSQRFELFTFTFADA